MNIWYSNYSNKIPEPGIHCKRGSFILTDELGVCFKSQISNHRERTNLLTFAPNLHFSALKITFHFWFSFFSLSFFSNFPLGVLSAKSAWPFYRIKFFTTLCLSIRSQLFSWAKFSYPRIWSAKNWLTRTEEAREEKKYPPKNTRKAKTRPEFPLPTLSPAQISSTPSTFHSSRQR